MPSQISYKNYGGRGIKVCDRWRKFEAFLEDMGELPEGMTLERDHSDLDYSPINCRWDSAENQAQNKTNTRWLTFGGETLPLPVWAKRLGIKPRTLRARLDDHLWPVERALTTPVMTYLESTTKAKDVRYGKAINWLAGQVRPNNADP